eukprot:scaffold17606_cov20-Tisochrysis_lutea.AAC.2
MQRLSAFGRTRLVMSRAKARRIWSHKAHDESCKGSTHLITADSWRVMQRPSAFGYKRMQWMYVLLHREGQRLEVLAEYVRTLCRSIKMGGTLVQGFCGTCVLARLRMQVGGACEMKGQAGVLNQPQSHLHMCLSACASPARFVKNSVCAKHHSQAPESVSVSVCVCVCARACVQAGGGYDSKGWPSALCGWCMRFARVDLRVSSTTASLVGGGCNSEGWARALHQPQLRAQLLHQGWFWWARRCPGCGCPGCGYGCGCPGCGCPGCGCGCGFPGCGCGCGCPGCGFCSVLCSVLCFLKSTLCVVPARFVVSVKTGLWPLASVFSCSFLSGPGVLSRNALKMQAAAPSEKGRLHGRAVEGHPHAMSSTSVVLLLPHLQIFSVEGTKHIGIYAKRRILPGEELSYDYKVLAPVQAPETTHFQGVLQSCRTPQQCYSCG